jgi:hypothetical protein
MQWPPLNRCNCRGKHFTINLQNTAFEQRRFAFEVCGMPLIWASALYDNPHSLAKLAA